MSRRRDPIAASIAATNSLQGVLPSMYRTALYSRDDQDRPVRSSGGYPVRVRAGLSGTFTTAHAGSVGDTLRDELQRRFEVARLTAAEQEAVRAQLAGEMPRALSVRLGITTRAVQQRLASARRKLAEIEQALEEMR